MSAAATIPGFSRVEIRTRGKSDLALEATELKQLAGELETLAGRNDQDEATATILAHHKIKATSQKLRGTQ